MDEERGSEREQDREREIDQMKKNQLKLDTMRYAQG